jgi:F0F1-type ATP synthase delta subunit
MQSRLEGFASALLGALDDAERSRVAGELTNLEQTVLARADLRGFLADTSISGVSRANVLNDLLVDKVEATTRRLAVYAAARVAAQEVAHSFAELAVMARTYSETGELDLPGLALLASRARISGFADAMLEDTPTEDFSVIGDQLFTWAQTVESHEALRRLLLDRDADLAARLGATDQLLGGRVDPTTLALARFVVVGGRPRDLVGTLNFLVDFVARAHDWRVARVHSARPLDEASRRDLTASLTQLTGHSVELLEADDASLLGGVLVEVGDLRLDATTRGRLGVLHDALAQGHLYESALSSNE